MKKILVFILLFLVGITSINIKAEDNTQFKKWGVYINNVMNSSVSIVAHTEDSHPTEEYKVELANIFYLYNYLSYTKFDILNKEQQDVMNSGHDLATIKVNLEFLNNNLGSEIEISKELYEMLDQAESIRKLSNGYFDYSIGKIIDLWKAGIKKYDRKEMPIDEFNELLSQVDLIEIDNEPILLSTRDNKYFVTVKENIKLDLGAFAKGYATQKAIEFFEAKNVKYYLINAGTSSIATGLNKEGNHFEIGLREPILEREIYGTAKISNTTITTSGDYEQYFTVNGTRFHHIISPKTKAPISNYHVLSIIGKDSGLMDAASTALFSMDLSEAKEFMNTIKAEGVFYHADLKISNLSTEVSLLSENQAEKLGIGRYLILGITIIVSIVLITAVVLFFIKNKNKLNENPKSKLIRDILLFGVLVVVFGGAFLNYHFWPRGEALSAVITYQQEAYVKINFQTQDIEIIKEQTPDYPKKVIGENYIEITILGDYKIDGVRQEVVIFVDFVEKRIRVSEEKSPYNLCSRQGWANHGYIICLPNSVSINFQTGAQIDGVV